MKSQNPQTSTHQINETKAQDRQSTGSYNRVEKIDKGPSHASVASKYGEDDKPWEEEDEDVDGPHPGVHEPFGVLVHIRRRHRLLIELCHLPDWFLLLLSLPSLPAWKMKKEKSLYIEEAKRREEGEDSKKKGRGRRGWRRAWRRIGQRPTLWTFLFSLLFKLTTSLIY